MPRVAIAALVGASLISLGAQAPKYDLLIVGGRIIDGSGQPARRGDVAIRKGQIVGIGRFSGRDGRETINAAGLMVAPGFIDVHTHADRLADSPLAENFARMGVTSVIAGNCGSSAIDVGEALAEVERASVSVNFATLIGHNTVRQAAMGTASRRPTVAEMARMRSMVWRAMADGAVGFSTGLEYVPGTYATLAEIIDLARIAANAGGVYATHMRNEGTALENALEESLRVGATTGIRVQISHLKVDSPSRWGASEKALSLIDAARARGVKVAADQYAYTAASSTLSIRFPRWALEGGQAAVDARLSDPAQWSKIKSDIRALLAARGLSDLSFAVVASYAPDPSLNGLTLKQIATKAKAADTLDAQLEVARDMMRQGGASMVYHFMSDDDVHRIMRHPMVGFASDSGVLAAGQGVPHPRGYGNTARILGEYVRERRILPMEEAIRKMTALPAEHFRLDRRGRLMEGYAADVVLFDPLKVRDTATFERPHAYPAGIPHVVVNGVPVVRDGGHTGARPGQAVTKGR